MNFLELCQRLSREAGTIGSGPATVISQTGESARMVGWIRTAWQEIQTERRWMFDWTQGSVEMNPSLTEYPMPADFDVWESQTLRFNGDRIKVLAWSELEPAERFTAVALAPDGTLHLNAAPSQSGPLSFEYWRTPQILEQNTDVPRMPERFHMAIVYRAHRQYGFYESAPEAVESAVMKESRIMQTLLQSQLPEIEQPEPLA